MNGAFFVPPTHHHHHHAPSHTSLHRSRSNHSEPDPGPYTIDDIPLIPPNITEPVPERNASTSRLAVSDYRPPGAGPLPSFTEATLTASSNVASEAASINAAPTPVLDGRVVLRIGEKQFFTTRATLAESHLLTALLSTEATHNGEYFLDADPDMFSQVIRFLRTRRFPLFYDHASGYDTAKYLELLVAAQFYQIPTLEMWLTEKRYLGAMNIKSEYKRYRLFGTDQITRMHELCWDREEQGRILSISETKGKAHACPQKLWRHDGDQGKCMKARCFQLRSSATSATNTSATMRLLDVTALVTRAEIRESVLSAGVYPEGPPPYQGGDDD
ncbi:BTB/POZ fold domain-containing protein [Cordyceps javanica]|uniref:BTB/POZ fold domain-containing protein n=1 Tax=Cordyceps javanica TaxID=43265 RepID=A0A545VDF3_9HYPO|nr:BTB/POZ fold domain-containing protein [Cordyceps javanica]TQW10573.1 BTB/POZ fold domain containing protein [Cordyceps javanica]